MATRLLIEVDAAGHRTLLRRWPIRDRHLQTIPEPPGSEMGPRRTMFLVVPDDFDMSELRLIERAEGGGAAVSEERGEVRETKLIRGLANDERWDLVLMGDGYTADELPKFEADADAFSDFLLITKPFDEFRNTINIHRVNVVSHESGASDRVVTRRTFFEAMHGGAGVEELLTINEELASEVAFNRVPYGDAAMVIVNTTGYGGSGGAVAAFGRGQHDLALHELGHTAFFLADEYQRKGFELYEGNEPPQPNVSIHTEGSKWRPTQKPVPIVRAGQKSDYDAEVVGAFEGGHQYRRGIYRPQARCRMREYPDPFCVVCQETIRRRLRPYKPPKRRSS